MTQGRGRSDELGAVPAMCCRKILDRLRFAAFIVNARLEPILSNKQACNVSLIAKGVLVQLEKLTTAGSRRLAECGFALVHGPEIERAHDLSVRQDSLSTAST